MTTPKVWQTFSRRVVYKDSYLTVRKDKVKKSDGSKSFYTVVVRKPISIIIPVSSDKTVFMVEQFRYAVNSVSLEFPMGSAEGKSPLEMAKTELRQETGITAKKWRKIGSFFVAPGHSTVWAHVFLAKDLIFFKPRPEKGEILEQREVKLSEIPVLIKKGKILDVPTIAAFKLWELSQ